jgi:predicted transporter
MGGAPGVNQAFGQMQQGIAQAGVAMGLQPGTLRPRVRNALMTMLVPLLIVVGSIAAAIAVVAIAIAVDAPAIAPLAGLLAFVGFIAAAVIGLLSLIRMIGELNSVTRTDAVQWWMFLIPIYHYYVAWVLVPQEVSKAKQMAGVQAPTRGIVVYIFLFLYALAADLNDIARQMPPG